MTSPKEVDDVYRKMHSSKDSLDEYNMGKVHPFKMSSASTTSLAIITGICFREVGKKANSARHFQRGKRTRHLPPAQARQALTSSAAACQAPRRTVGSIDKNDLPDAA